MIFPLESVTIGTSGASGTPEVVAAGLGTRSPLESVIEVGMTDDSAPATVLKAPPTSEGSAPATELKAGPTFEDGMSEESAPAMVLTAPPTFEGSAPATVLKAPPIFEVGSADESAPATVLKAPPMSEGSGGTTSPLASVDEAAEFPPTEGVVCAAAGTTAPFGNIDELAAATLLPNAFVTAVYNAEPVGTGCSEVSAPKATPAFVVAGEPVLAATLLCPLSSSPPRFVAVAGAPGGDAGRGTFDVCAPGKAALNEAPTDGMTLFSVVSRFDAVT